MSLAVHIRWGIVPTHEPTALGVERVHKDLASFDSCHLVPPLGGNKCQVHSPSIHRSAHSPTCQSLLSWSPWLSRCDCAPMHPSASICLSTANPKAVSSWVGGCAPPAVCNHVMWSGGPQELQWWCTSTWLPSSLQHKQITLPLMAAAMVDCWIAFQVGGACMSIKSGPIGAVGDHSVVVCP